jgi:hypothetical protein
MTIFHNSWSTRLGADGAPKQDPCESIVDHAPPWPDWFPLPNMWTGAPCLILSRRSTHFLDDDDEDDAFLLGPHTATAEIPWMVTVGRWRDDAPAVSHMQAQRAFNDDNEPGAITWAPTIDEYNGGDAKLYYHSIHSQAFNLARMPALDGIDYDEIWLGHTLCTP